MDTLGSSDLGGTSTQGWSLKGNHLPKVEIKFSLEWCIDLGKSHGVYIKSMMLVQG